MYGDAVNVASRMESNAPVNRIMLPHDAMRRVSEVFEFEDHGDIRVKGKTEPVKVYVVKGVQARPLRRWRIHQSMYVGREPELARLQECYEARLATAECSVG